jgi:hypothetical protein
MSATEDDSLAPGDAVVGRALRGTFLIGTAVVLLTTGCVRPAKIIAPMKLMVTVPPSVVEAGDAIAIIPDRGARCIGESFRQIHSTLRIVSPDEFRRAAFSDQTSDQMTFTYPIPESQQTLLSSQAFRDRIAPLRLRYLVSVDEEESRRSTVEGARGGIGLTWYRSFRLTAFVIDLEDGRAVAQILVRAEGESNFALLLGVIPIGWATTVRPGPVCRTLGEGLGNFLAGRDPAYGIPPESRPAR